MIEYINSLDLILQVYYGLAIVGGIIFLVQLLMLFLGFSTDGITTDVPDSSTYAFKFFSLQGLSGFFLIFGLIGAYTQDITNNGIISFIAGLVAGLIMNFIICKLINMLLKLQSSGNLDYQNAIGLSGTVYLSIHKGEVGQVQINIQNRLVFPKAVSADNEEIKTGERVKVVRVDSDNILVVEKC